MGRAVAAEQVAAYEINGLISDLTEVGSVLSQVAYDALTTSIAKARALREAVVRGHADVRPSRKGRAALSRLQFRACSSFKAT